MTYRIRGTDIKLALGLPKGTATASLSDIKTKYAQKYKKEDGFSKLFLTSVLKKIISGSAYYRTDTFYDSFKPIFEGESGRSFCDAFKQLPKSVLQKIPSQLLSKLPSKLLLGVTSQLTLPQIRDLYEPKVTVAGVGRIPGPVLTFSNIEPTATTDDQPEEATPVIKTPLDGLKAHYDLHDTVDLRFDAMPKLTTTKDIGVVYMTGKDQFFMVDLDHAKHHVLVKLELTPDGLRVPSTNLSVANHLSFHSMRDHVMTSLNRSVMVDTLVESRSVKEMVDYLKGKTPGLTKSLDNLVLLKNAPFDNSLNEAKFKTVVGWLNSFLKSTFESIDDSLQFNLEPLLEDRKYLQDPVFRKNLVDYVVTLLYMRTQPDGENRCKAALAIWPAQANWKCTDGAKVEIEEATAELSSPMARLMSRFLTRHSGCIDRLTIPAGNEIHIRPAIQLALGLSKEAIDQKDKNAYATLQYMTVADIEGVRDAFKDFILEEIMDVFHFLQKHTLTADDKDTLSRNPVFNLIRKDRDLFAVMSDPDRLMLDCFYDDGSSKFVPLKPHEINDALIKFGLTPDHFRVTQTGGSFVIEVKSDASEDSKKQWSNLRETEKQSICFFLSSQSCAKVTAEAGMLFEKALKEVALFTMSYDKSETSSPLEGLSFSSLMSATDDSGLMAIHKVLTNPTVPTVHGEDVLLKALDLSVSILQRRVSGDYSPYLAAKFVKLWQGEPLIELPAHLAGNTAIKHRYLYVSDLFHTAFEQYKNLKLKGMTVALLVKNNAPRYMFTKELAGFDLIDRSGSLDSNHYIELGLLNKDARNYLFSFYSPDDQRLAKMLIAATLLQRLRDDNPSLLEAWRLDSGFIVSALKSSIHILEFEDAVDSLNLLYLKFPKLPKEDFDMVLSGVQLKQKQFAALVSDSRYFKLALRFMTSSHLSQDRRFQLARIALINASDTNLDEVKRIILTMNDVLTPSQIKFLDSLYQSRAEQKHDRMARAEAGQAAIY
jgi:hypothetical protein